MRKIRHFFLTTLAVLCSTLTTWADPYSGTPTTPLQITAGNYTDYGFTADNYSGFVGYYGIGTAEELYGFAALVNGGETSANGVLTADIVVNENVLKDDGTLNGTPTYSWTPIGTSSKKFKGTFDGNNHSVSGLYYNNTTSSDYPDGGNNVGLMGYANGVTIKNVGVIDSYFKGNQHVGGICGLCNGTITNCYNTASINGNSYTAGISAGGGTITNCHNTASINGSDYTAGICGYGGTISNCYNTGRVNGIQYIGGINGRNGIINNCYNTGNVTSGYNYKGYYVGGISGAGNKITNCYNIGIISNTHTNYAYLVGAISGYSCPIENCYYLEGCAYNAKNVEQHGIGNSSPSSSTADEPGKTESLTLDDFKSGKVTFLLNGSVSGGNVWYQSINTDDIPMLDDTHGVVYATAPCPSDFSNSALAYKEHDMDDFGECRLCGKYMPATLITDENHESLGLESDFIGYYAIANAGQLYWFAEFVNDGAKDINGVLISDIVVNENVLDINGNLRSDDFRLWTPIGFVGNSFEGTFNGNGHAISGLYYNDLVKTTGFIGSAIHSTIKNLGIVDSYFCGYQYVGAICCMSSNCVISGCYNTGTIDVYNSNGTGGICGTCNGTITNCYNSGKIREIYGGGHVGGISGSGGTLTNCYNVGTISGNSNVGGICGSGGTVSNCFYLENCATDGNHVVQNGIGSSTVGETNTDIEGETTVTTTVELASGIIGYLLNSNGNNAWHQNLYSDEMPLLDPTHNPATGYIIENDDTYTVIGDMYLEDDYEIVIGKTLYVPVGSSLTSTGGAVITNNGTFRADGTLAGNNLAGEGTFITNYMRNCNVKNLNNSYVYKGSSFTLEDGLSAVILASDTTILGKTFTIDASYSGPLYKNNRNVGTATISWTNNADAENIISRDFEITPITLTITDIAAVNKVYDGNSVAECTYSYNGILENDNVSVSYTAVFADKKVGNGKAVSFNFTKSGADAANYVFANATGSTTANITPKKLTVSNITANEKVYDGNRTAEGSYSYDADIVEGDEVTVNYTAAFEDKNVDTNKRVVFGFTKTGADAGNYQFTNATDYANANITARTLTLSNFVADGKTYDGTTDATGGAFSDNRVSGDALGFTYDYSFENKNVGTNKNVNFSNIAISGGADKGNYTLAATTGAAKADITVKTLAISNIAAASKTYDGNTTTTVSYTTDKVATDDVTFGTTATFADKNVGNGKAVSFNYTKSGADAANYAFANESGSTTANIEPRELAISSVSAASKEYDGNTATTVTITASNIVSGDVVTFGTAAAFADKNVGTNKTVNFTYTKSGADAANYSFANATGTATANITARTLTLSNFVANGKTYDGTTNATGGAFSDNRVSGDVLQFTYDYSFENKNVGTNKNVNFSNIAISGGADKGNYTLAATTGAAKADITVKTLAISNIAAASKTYDGNTTTTVSYTADVFRGDDVTFGTAATFDNKNAGTGKQVTFNYTKSGADAANYAFANATGSTTANIEPRELAISSVSAASKEYDGNTATTVTIAASNIVSGDVVTFGTAAAFADKNVGTNKTVNFTYTKNGADAANYAFAQATGTATAAISARELTLSNFVAADKVYDGTVAGSGSFSDDRVSGDVLEFSYTVEFDDENANTDIDVYFSDIEISGGADKDNYYLDVDESEPKANADITPVTDEVVVTIAMPTRTVAYNGHEGRYAMPEMPDVFSWNSNLYNLSAVAPADMAEYQATLQNIQQKTDVGEYPLGWNNETFVNVSRNFSNVSFSVTDGKLIITPKTGVVVTITENSGELAYNTEEQSVEGYTYSIDDELGIYSEDDFAFSGNAVVAGTTVGTYPMQLSAADFSNTNTNFANVTFNIVDGALTINKAAEAPNKPAATMETRYIVTQLVALPENWKWADEQQALEEGSNVATANYVGADKGNYVIESVDVTITRLECLHNEGNEVLYTLEPTCTHKGYTGNLSCKLCGEIYEMGDSIPALGHDFVETVVAPTCTTDGYTTHFCARDNYTEYSDTVPATGHNEDVAVFENIVAATCTEAGSQDSVVYCSVCKEELSRTVLEIPATGHKDSVVIENIVRPTLEAAGSYDSVVYCSVCKVELSRKTIDVLASAVAVSKLPNKVEYKQGEALDVKGGKITATYSDESTAEFEMLAGWVSGFDSEKVGKQTLTVKFETVSSTLTTTFDVTVNAKDDDNTAIDEDTAEISIYAYSNIIVVEAADAITGEIAVFDVNGRMVRKTLAAGTRIEIEMPRQGLYIVRVGNQAKRVVIK